MRRLAHSIYLLGGIGAALMLTAALLDGGIDERDLRVVGAVIILYALVSRCLSTAARPTVAAYELGRTDGYQEGYRDGRKISRPVVVKLPVACRKDAGERGCGTASDRGASVLDTTSGTAPLESAEWRAGADSPN